MPANRRSRLITQGIARSPNRAMAMIDISDVGMCAYVITSMLPVAVTTMSTEAHDQKGSAPADACLNRFGTAQETGQQNRAGDRGLAGAQHDYREQPENCGLKVLHSR